jgi:hypothetical protein
MLSAMEVDIQDFYLASSPPTESLLERCIKQEQLMLVILQKKNLTLSTANMEK